MLGERDRARARVTEREISWQIHVIFVLVLKYKCGIFNYFENIMFLTSKVL